jgi:tetratricopeptide (TPR) repeat protein/tRNA A-37 threonylcarbamoyl transferase component Bud32
MDDDVVAVFRAVADRVPAERRQYYSQHQVSASVREEVESLLRFDREPARSLTSMVASATETVLQVDAAMREGTRWGRYRFIRVIGRGGMGTVYEAEQDSPRRSVALKVIKPELASKELTERFAQESAALARLQHPGIAQIYESGTAQTDLGPQAYFAMEFIRGEAVTDYTDAHRLDARRRLELLAKICDAVHHAHQRGIIHRDLKPGNILVDETGQPKILDFGVARVTDSDVMTMRTDVGELVGTLGYMSPEQVLADPLEVDIRSDVYSLGVIAYELLGKRLPYDTRGQLRDAVQVIGQKDPPLLGTIDRAYRGDIEIIVAKALEKDKARRYNSAADLAADIRRHLENEAIIARPPSTIYQLQKFASRHKALVAGTAAVFVALAAGLTAATWEAVRANRAEQTARATNEFLEHDLLAQAGMRAQAGPTVKPDPDLKVRTALDRAAATVAGRFESQPVVEASIRQTIGHTYYDLGLFPEAQRQLERAVDLRRGSLGDNSLGTLASTSELAQLYRDEGKYAQAESLFTTLLERQRRALGKEHADTLNTMLYLGRVYRDEAKFDQAESMLRSALEAQRRTKGEQHPDTLDTMTEVGLLLTHQEKYDQAKPLYVRALEGERRVHGEEHPDTLTVMNNLGAMYYAQKNFEEAAPLFEKVLGVRRRVLGGEHPETLISMNNVGAAYRELGKYTQAEQLYTQALEIRRRLQGAEHPDALTVATNLGGLYTSEGRYEDAEALLSKVLVTRTRVLGKEHPNTLNTQWGLGEAYRRQGKPERAEPLFATVAESRSRALGARNSSTALAWYSFGQVRIDQQKYAAAEAPLRTALGVFDAIPESWGRYGSEALLGASLEGQRQYASAEPLLVSGYEGLRRFQKTVPPAERALFAKAERWILQLYRDANRPEKEIEWRSRFERDDASATAKH